MFTVIGAGPAGNYLAYQLAKKGEKVHVYEDHEVIGSPVQCTGIITNELCKHLTLSSSFVRNRIRRARLIAPDGGELVVRFDHEDIIVDRTPFDQHLAMLAEQEGARFFLKHRYKGNCGKEVHVGEKKVKTDYLVGADGPHSRVAKENGMWCERKTIIGNQVTVEADCDDLKMMEIWLGIGLFSWCVPEGNGVCRVGTMSYDTPAEHLQELLQLRCPEAKVLGRQPGHIPIYNPRQILQKDFVSLIGDAATQVKATSYGGIIHGMKAAEIFAREPGMYQKNCRKELGRDLSLSLLMRKAMDRCSNDDWNTLVSLFTQEKIKRILETHSRDVPTSFALKLLWKEPRLLKYCLKAL